MRLYILDVRRLFFRIDNDEIEPRKAEISVNLDILRIKFVASLIIINRSRAALL